MRLRNQGLTPAELSDKIQLVAPRLSYKLVTNYRTRTLRNKTKGRLKPNSVMPQQGPIETQLSHASTDIQLP